MFRLSFLVVSPDLLLFVLSPLLLLTATNAPIFTIPEIYSCLMHDLPLLFKLLEFHPVLVCLPVSLLQAILQCPSIHRDQNILPFPPARSAISPSVRLVGVNMGICGRGCSAAATPCVKRVVQRKQWLYKALAGPLALSAGTQQRCVH